MRTLLRRFERTLSHEYGKSLVLALSFGLVFGLGFVAGRMAPGKRVERSVAQIDSLKALENRAHEYEEIQKKLKLTYYSELSSQAKTHATEEFVAPDTPAKIPEVLVEENAPKPASVEEEKPSSARMAKAVATVLGQETPEPVKETIRQSLPASTGSAFAIQVAALPDREKAEAAVRLLKSKGHAARLVQADVPGKGVIYRIRVHGFKSREEADEYRLAKGLDGMTVDQSR